MSESYNFVLSRLDWPEGPLIERKAEGDHRDWPKTLVAFANSTPQNDRAILFIGASNQKPHKGIATEKALDEVQRKVADFASTKCFPPIPVEIIPLVIKQEGRDCRIVAVIVSASSARPHFAGPAYTRSGSKSPPATAELYQELIASHNTKAGRLHAWKGRQVQWKLIGTNRMHLLGNATVRDVTGVSATIQDDTTGQGHPVPWSDIEFLDRGSLPPVLEIKYWASDRELMELMLSRWSFFVSTNAEQYHPQLDYLVRQIDLHPELFEPVAKSMIMSNRASKSVCALHQDLLERLGKAPRLSVTAGRQLGDFLQRLVLGLPH